MKRTSLLAAVLAAAAITTASANEPATGCNLGLPGRHFECDENGQFCTCVVDDPAVYPLCEIRVMYRYDRPTEAIIMVPSLNHCTEERAITALYKKMNDLRLGEPLPRVP